MYISICKTNMSRACHLSHTSFLQRCSCTCTRGHVTDPLICSGREMTQLAGRQTCFSSGCGLVRRAQLWRVSPLFLHCSNFSEGSRDLMKACSILTVTWTGVECFGTTVLCGSIGVISKCMLLLMSSFFQWEPIFPCIMDY